MTLTLRKIQYDPGTGTVALLIQHALGSFFVNTTETKLLARVVAPATTWGNAEALAEAQPAVDVLFPGQGFVVVLPGAPA